MIPSRSRLGIVAFAFGTPYNLESNKEIAFFALKEAKKWGVPIYTQIDIYITPTPKVCVYYKSQIMGSTPSTLQVAKGAAEWIKKFGLNEIWVVGAPCHMSRCLRDLRYVAKTEDLRILIKHCKPKKSERWFSSKSLQWWTRSSLQWWLREATLRLIPVKIYEKITG